MSVKKIKKIRLNISDQELKKDLEEYCKKAIEFGAQSAQFIPTGEIPVDDRVALKCSIPKCFGYGTSAHCPPHSMKPNETRSILQQYNWAVIFKLEVPPEIIVRDRSTIKERVEAYRKVFEIVNKIESSAFYDGHYLAVGFGAGSCKSTFCYDKECTVLAGEKCRLSLRARPSMEAVGIDCYRFAAEQGWEIYPIGSDAKVGCIPHGTLMGLVLID